MPSRKLVPITNPPSSLSPSKPTSPKPKKKLLPLKNYEEQIVVIELISQAKFPVYLARSPSTGKVFALKVFPYHNNEPHPYFENEIRFSFLDHPNVIKVAYIPNETMLTADNGKEQPASSILMEYAPYGDLFDLLIKASRKFDEKLTRTYFHQLIDGIEYLYKNNVFHLDIKLENLLIGDDYQLKIADFDLSYIKGDSDIITTGTKYYRAPELRDGSKQVSEASDIYSAGIILFVLKCGGVLPHCEDESCMGVNLGELMSGNPAEFFNTHCHIQGKKLSFFSNSFKELFMAMMRSDAEDRISIKEIKRSKWYRDSVYSPKELRKIMKELLFH